MVLFQTLGTSCFDVYQLINICIPTLTKEVVKQSQNKSVNKFVQTAVAGGKKAFAFLNAFTAPAVNPGFAVVA